ncbi:MAG: methyltransferase [Catalinimonas sp.]
MNTFDTTYWEGRYQRQQTQWDAGSITTPLQTYFDGLHDRTWRILIPGAGNSYEAGYLHERGFLNVYLCDVAPTPLENFQRRHPDFPPEHLLHQNFFDLTGGAYDLIVEQTFFCALAPALRPDYAAQMHRLLKPGGRLVGLLFDAPLNQDHPPFGGDRTEYLTYFEGLFEVHTFERAHNSIPPRAGRELFVDLRRPVA